MLLIIVVLPLQHVLRWIFIGINNGADVRSLEAAGQSAVVVLAYRSGPTGLLSSTARSCQGLRGRWTGLITSLMVVTLLLG